MQIKADVFQRKSVVGQLIYRELEKLSVIRLLMYLRSGGEELFIYPEKVFMREAVSGISLFGIRAAEVEIKPLDLLEIHSLQVKDVSYSR